MKLKGMIMHLDRAAERAEQVQVLCNTLPFPSQVISAVDGLALTPEETAAYERVYLQPRYPFDLRPSEVACFHSHRKCWQSIVDEGLEAALILEDDVDREAKVFDRALELALSHIELGDFVRFPVKLRETEGDDLARQGNTVLRRPREIGLGMVGQIVTHDAAKGLLKATETFDRPVDCFLQMRWVHRYRVLTVWPSGVHEVSHRLGGSMIGHKQNSFQAKLTREILRPLYRSKISRLARQSFNG